MSDIIKTLIDIYGRVGDFRITPYDGALPMSEADRLAREAVEQHDKAVLAAIRAEIEDIENPFNGGGAPEMAHGFEQAVENIMDLIQFKITGSTQND